MANGASSVAGGERAGATEILENRGGPTGRGAGTAGRRLRGWRAPKLLVVPVPARSRPVRGRARRTLPAQPVSFVLSLPRGPPPPDLRVCTPPRPQRATLPSPRHLSPALAHHEQPPRKAVHVRAQAPQALRTQPATQGGPRKATNPRQRGEQEVIPPPSSPLHPPTYHIAFPA